MKQRLNNIKGILSQYISIIDYDTDNIEYLIDIVDNILQDKVKLNKESIQLFIEEALVTYAYHNHPDILKVVEILKEIEEIICTQ